MNWQMRACRRQVIFDARSVIPMSEHDAKFQVGQIIHHKRFDYIGVVFDVDLTFQGTGEWYEQAARSRPSNVSNATFRLDP